MRLVFVTHSFSPPDRPLANVGGMQRVAMELDAALQRKQSNEFSYDAILLVASWKWIHVLVAPFLIKTFFSLRKRIKRGEVDVIVFSSMVTAWLALPLRKLLKQHAVRVASIVHGLDVTTPNTLYQKVVPHIFGALDIVLPVSGPTGEACVERGLPSAKVRVVNNGVELDRFPLFEMRAGARASHPFRSDLPKDAILLTSVGRQVKRKGFAWFIEHVMPRLPEHVHYWLGGDGPEGDAIQSAIDANHLGNRVRLLGRLGDAQLTNLYQSADLFLMPNIPVPGDMEGFGIVMLEAAMNGLPVVAARLEGIKEVITVGKNGYFVESGDITGYTDRIVTLDLDRTSLGALSDSSRAHVAETFGWDAVAEQYLEHLS